MRIKKPYIATLDQVKISRQGEHGIIEYIEPNVSTTYLKIGPEIVYSTLADEILQSPPVLGYLTISNALQWRLQYSRIVNLTENVSGIVKII